MKRVAVCCVFIALAALTGPAQGSAGRKSVAVQPEPQFRYSVVRDETKAVPYSNGKVPGRMVDVLIDPKDFNVENLTALFKYLSNLYPTPVILDIVVHTDPKTLSTTEDVSAIGLRTLELDPSAWHSRFLNGSGGFSYTAGVPGKFKIIFVKIPS